MQFREFLFCVAPTRCAIPNVGALNSRRVLGRRSAGVFELSSHGSDLLGLVCILPSEVKVRSTSPSVTIRR
jgi:hypothetical protein